MTLLDNLIAWCKEQRGHSSSDKSKCWDRANYIRARDALERVGSIRQKRTWHAPSASSPKSMRFSPGILNIAEVDRPTRPRGH